MGGTAVRVLFISLLFAGCGKVSQSRPDAGNPDDAGNTGDGGTTIDADPSGIATVVTEAALFGATPGAKVGSIDIVSNLPDNSMLAAAKTDANGGAAIQVFAGGSVTAIYKHTVDLGADLITWVGVKPGDTLTFGNRNFSTVGQPNTSLGSQTYSWPALAGASHYKVWTACKSDGVPVDSPNLASPPVPEFPLCNRDPNNMTALFAALDANNALIGYGIKTGLKFVNSATVALPSWNTAATASITMTGLPSEATSVTGNFRVVVDPLSDFNPSLGYSGTLTGGAFTANLGVAQGVGQRILGAVDLVRGGQFRLMHVLDALSISTLSQTLAAPGLPPWSQTRTTASAGSQMVSWILVPNTSSAHKGQLVHMTWNHAVAGATSTSQWDVILPPGQASNSFGFPKLPAPLSDTEPAATDTLNASTRVFEIPSVKDYDALRAMRSANLMCLECAVRTGDLQRVVFTDTL